MKSGPMSPHETFAYTAGLDKIFEPVISSHFMEKLSMRASFTLYDQDQFADRSILIDGQTVRQRLLPALILACERFARERAAAAIDAAARHYRDYGLNNRIDVSLEHCITEVMFDRQYRRRNRQTCSRLEISRHVRERVARGVPIDMAIPALPFKFLSPLKARGELPDLAEVNFILGLYEIVTSIQLIYGRHRPHLTGPLARFTVVSDGGRFGHMVRVPDTAIGTYRAHLQRWIDILGLADKIFVLDYKRMVHTLLPADARAAKCNLGDKALSEYATTMWAIFDPANPREMLRRAASVDPDPEAANSQGRFVSLVRSLVYTMNYESLEGLDPRAYVDLYRQVTQHLFEPYTSLPVEQTEPSRSGKPHHANSDMTDADKEHLRCAMLREVWAAAIAYMAEIRSDRDLEIDTILTCLPHHFRWTIHPKPGQLAISTWQTDGLSVQAWAGTAVFHSARNGRIKLCTLPVLALEGSGARPVRIPSAGDDLYMGHQPLFYIDQNITVNTIEQFISCIESSLVRKRCN